MAIYRGLHLCLNLGIYNLLVESNCQVIVQAIQQLENSFAMLENVVHDIQMLMSRFSHCEIQFRYRSSNVIAHKLAHYAWNVSHTMLWYGEYPEFLNLAVWYDKQSCNTDSPII